MKTLRYSDIAKKRCVSWFFSVSMAISMENPWTNIDAEWSFGRLIPTGVRVPIPKLISIIRLMNVFVIDTISLNPLYNTSTAIIKYLWPKHIYKTPLIPSQNIVASLSSNVNAILKPLHTIPPVIIVWLSNYSA